MDKPNKISELYSLVPKGAFKDELELTEYLTDANKLKEFYSLMPQGAFKDETEFLDYFGDAVKKKSISGEIGATASQVSAEPPKESLTPEQPLPSAEKPKEISTEDIFPKTITPTSVLKASSNKLPYLQQKVNSFMDETQAEFTKEETDIISEYKKKSKEEEADTESLKADAEKKLITLRDKKQKEYEAKIDELYERQGYEVLAEKDIKNVEKMVGDIMSQNRTFEVKKKALEDLKAKLMKAVSAVADTEYAKKFESELNDVIAQNSLFDENDVSVFGWKMEAQQRLDDNSEYWKKAESEFRNKYPDFKERTYAMPGGMAQTQGWSPSIEEEANPAKRKKFQEDYQRYKKDRQLLGIAREKLGNILQLPDNNKADLLTAFQVGGLDLLGAVSSAGWTDTARALELGVIGDKLKKGEELSYGEKAIFDAKGIFDVAYGGVEGGEVGKQIAPMIPFIESLMLPGMAGAKPIQATIKEILKKEGIGLLTKKGIGTAFKEFGKLGLKELKRAPLYPMSQVRALEGMRGQSILTKEGEWDIDKETVEGFLEASRKGIGTGWTEALTESLSTLVGGGGLLKVLGKQISIPPALIKAIEKISKTTKVGGVTSEVGEELFNIPLQAGVVGDQPLSEVGVKDVWETVWVTAATTSLLGIPAYGVGFLDVMERKRDKQIVDIFGRERIAEIRNAMVSMDAVAWEKAINDAVEGRDGSIEGMTDKTARNRLYEYSKSLAIEEIAKKNKQIKTEEGTTDAEGIGKKIETTGEQAQGVVEGEEGSLRVRDTEKDRLEAEQGKEVEHKANVEQKFREAFKDVPQEQTEGALALLEARAKSWASEQKGRTPEQYYQRIADVKTGEFQEGAPKLYQLPDGRQVMGIAMPEVTQGFYSPIEKRLLDFKQEKASVNKWKEIIGKGDEATFTGVLDYLNKLKPDQSLTKAEINQFMKDNRIEVVEVVKGETQPEYRISKDNNLYYENFQASFEIRHDKGVWRVYDPATEKDVAEFNNADEAVNYVKDKDRAFEFNKEKNTSKFSQYQLPGEKENYKEMLVTMPAKEPSMKLPKYWEVKEISGFYTVFDASGDIRATDTTREGAIKKAQGGVSEHRLTQPTGQEFISSHFPEVTNPVVHLRMNTRTDSDGKKVLFLEEIQSDWGQKGKKEGFAEEEKFDKSKVSVDVKHFEGIGWLAIDRDTGMELKEAHSAMPFKSEKEAWDYIEGQWKKSQPKTKGYPTAPFVTDTNAWVKLGLKTALKEAVKQGVDKIAWTTGEQQSERYKESLVAEIEEIEISSKSLQNPKSTRGLTFMPFEGRRGAEGIYLEVDDSGIITYETNTTTLGKMTDKPLSDVLTKGMAEDIMSRPKDTSFKPTDLKINSQGMIGFYGSPQESKLGIVGNIAKSLFKQEPKIVSLSPSKITDNDLVKYAQKLTKQEAIDRSKKGETIYFVSDSYKVYPIKKTQEVQLGFSMYPNMDMYSEPKFPQQHSISITPELKAEVEKGLPLFQKEGKRKAKGAIETLEDGRVIIHALSNPDFSTIIHEISHLFEKDLTAEEVSKVEKWSGKKQGTKDFSEAFARAGERYVRDGVAPTKELQPIFEKFKQWLTDIYRRLKGSPIEKKLSPEVKSIFDRLLTEQKAKEEETLIFAAPWASKVIKDFNDESAFNEDAYKEFKDVIAGVSKAMGYPIEVVNKVVGGWFDGNKKIHEPSIGIKVPTQNQEDIDLLSALVGALAKDTQASVVRAMPREEADGTWTEVGIKNIDAVTKITDELKKLGFSFEKDNNLLYIGTQNEEQLDNLYNVLGKHGKGITGIKSAPAKVDFFEKGSYLPTLERYGDRSHKRYGGVEGENLYNYVRQATDKLRGEEVKPAEAPKEAISAPIAEGGGVTPSPPPSAVKELVTEQEGQNQYTLGIRALNSNKLDQDIKDAIQKEGINYIPRGRKVRAEEAQEIVNLFSKEEGGLDKIEAMVYNTKNDILNDTRTFLNVYLADAYNGLKNDAVDIADRDRLRQKVVDLYMFGMEQGKLGGQHVEAQKEWAKVFGNSPEMVSALIRNHIERKNKAFFDSKEDEIKAAKQLLDDVFGSPEGRARIEQEVADEIGKIGTKNFGKESKKKIDDFFNGLLIDPKRQNLYGGLLGIPVAAWNGSVLAVKNAVLLGVDITTAIQRGAEYLDKWYKDEYGKGKIASPDWNRKEYEAHMRDKFSGLKKEVPIKEKPTRKKEPKIKTPPTQEEMVDKLLEKMAGFATKKQLQNFMKDYMQEFHDKGMIGDQRFKDLLAKALGMDYVSDKTEAQLTASAQTLGRAQKKIKEVIDAFDQLEKVQPDTREFDELRKKLKTLQKEAEKASFDAQKANQYIKTLLTEEPELLDKIGTLIQGNLLVPTSIIRNIYGNFFMSPARATRYLVMNTMDAILSQAGIMRNIAKQSIDPVKHPDLYRWAMKLPTTERTVNMRASFRGYREGLWAGLKEGVRQLKTGQLEDDYNKKEIQRGLEPIKALTRLRDSLTGKEKRKFDKLVGDILESMPAGYMGEGMFRLLNLGDKPFRRAAERARLSEIAELKGLKGVSRDKFINNPDNASLAEAQKAGDFAVYTNDNFVSKIIEYANQTFKKGQRSNVDAIKSTSTIAKALFKLGKATTLPYVRTPVNLAIEAFEYAVPTYSLARAMEATYKGRRREALDFFGKAVVGTIISSVAVALIKNGIMTPAGSEEDKLKQAEFAGKEGYRLNIDAFNRWLNGGDTGWKDGDNTVTLKGFGTMSMILMAYGAAYKDKTAEEIEKETAPERWATVFGSVVTSSLEQSIMTGVNTALQAALKGEKERDRWLINTANAMSTVVYPNTLATISKTFADENYLRETRDLSKEEGQLRSQMVNTFKDRMFMGKDLPTKVSIWGEPVKLVPDGNTWTYNLLGVSKNKKYQKYSFGTKMFELYEEYKKTNPDEAKMIFPSLPSPATKVGWDDSRMSPQDLMNYQIRVGELRAEYAENYINSEEFQNADLDEKTRTLSNMYSKARQIAESEMFSWTGYKDREFNKWLTMLENDALPLPSMIRQLKSGVKEFKLDNDDIEMLNNIALTRYAERVIPYINGIGDNIDTLKKVNERTGKNRFVEHINDLWRNSLDYAKREMVRIKRTEK